MINDMSDISGEKEVRDIIASDPWMMEVLDCAKELDLPGWMIGAGFVRNKVWDVLHGYGSRTLSGDTDIDLIYFDPDNREKDREMKYEMRLKARADENWSVKNHARMSERYLSCEDGMRYWPEVCTAVAVKLDEGGGLEIIAPYGLDDLLGLVVRRGCRFDDETAYRDRIWGKGWAVKWPRLRII
jgi:hypothetical protein